MIIEKQYLFELFDLVLIYRAWLLWKKCIDVDFEYPFSGDKQVLKDLIYSDYSQNLVFRDAVNTLAFGSLVCA